MVKIGFGASACLAFTAALTLNAASACSGGVEATATSAATEPRTEQEALDEEQSAEPLPPDLTEDATLACANVELALLAFKEGDHDRAAGYAVTGADLAATSGDLKVAVLADTVRLALDDPGWEGAVTDFLDVCAQAGYEVL